MNRPARAALLGADLKYALTGRREMPGPNEDIREACELSGGDLWAQAQKLKGWGAPSSWDSPGWLVIIDAWIEAGSPKDDANN